MENKKVIEIIQAGLAWANWTDEQKEAFIIAGEAVKKQQCEWEILFKLWAKIKVLIAQYKRNVQ